LYARLQVFGLPVDTVCRIQEVMTSTSHPTWSCVKLLQHICGWLQVGGHSLAWTHVEQFLGHNSYINFTWVRTTNRSQKQTYSCWRSEISQMWFAFPDSFIVFFCMVFAVETLPSGDLNVGVVYLQIII
jgi:hypothetical protein